MVLNYDPLDTIELFKRIAAANGLADKLKSYIQFLENIKYDDPYMPSEEVMDRIVEDISFWLFSKEEDEIATLLLAAGATPLA
jgi:hypothetical protein